MCQNSSFDCKLSTRSNSSQPNANGSAFVNGTGLSDCDISCRDFKMFPVLVKDIVTCLTNNSGTQLTTVNILWLLESLIDSIAMYLHENHMEDWQSGCYSCQLLWCWNTFLFTPFLAFYLKDFLIYLISVTKLLKCLHSKRRGKFEGSWTSKPPKFCNTWLHQGVLSF